MNIEHWWASAILRIRNKNSIHSRKFVGIYFSNAIIIMMMFHVEYICDYTCMRYENMLTNYFKWRMPCLSKYYSCIDWIFQFLFRHRQAAHTHEKKRIKRRPHFGYKSLCDCIVLATNPASLLSSLHFSLCRSSSYIYWINKLMYIQYLMYIFTRSSYCICCTNR